MQRSPLPKVSKQKCGKTLITACSNTNSKKVKLCFYILDEPRNTTITVIPSSMVKEGEDVTLICSTYGSPTPAVFWKKRQADGTSELILERDTLTITNVQPEDMGYYECEAVNLAGKESKATEIVVQGKYFIVNQTLLPDWSSFC